MNVKFDKFEIIFMTSKDQGSRLDQLANVHQFPRNFKFQA